MFLIIQDLFHRKKLSSRGSLALLCVCAGFVADAEPRSLLILHTNDLHDHVRADYDGDGGLAYVAGYIQTVRAERDDTLVLDAGDVMEKGDLVVFRDKSRMMYEAMARIGFDAGAPGNHDDAYGDDHLDACAELAQPMRLLAVNLLRPDGSLRFPASHVFERNGLRVGVIGVFKPRDEHALDLAQTAEAVAEEADRLEPGVDLIVVVAHLGPKDCATIADRARDVDVFVSGHTHQALRQPLVNDATGALIVQAGSYAEYVGRLELTIDEESEEILDYNGELIEMDHDTIAPDDAMQAWFTEKETELSPEADDYVATTQSPVGYRAMAYLGAEGVRHLAGEDIGFCHASQIIRATLPEGEVDVNAVFRTGGQRGYDTVALTLRGREIAAYIEGIANTDWGKTHWSGFRGAYERAPEGLRLIHNLEPDKEYRVTMPRKEWDTRCRRYFERHGEGPVAARMRALRPQSVPVTFTDGVAALLKEKSDSVSVEALAAQIERSSLLNGE